MNIFITGGCGFIGSNIIDYHLKKGDSVWIIDNLLLGKEKNISKFLNNKNFKFNNQDLLLWNKLEDAVLWADRIYHMAAIIGQKMVITHPIDVISSNIYGCERILKIISKSKRDVQLLISSSSSIYGLIDQKTSDSYKETDVLQIPSGKFIQETYPLSKIINEVMALSYLNNSKATCCIARIFNCIGINQRSRYGMVVPTFIKQAMNGIPITIFGDGSQTRSFCNVKDTINLFDQLLNTPKANNQIINIGNDKEISIKELAFLVKKLTKSSSEIKYIPYKEAYGMDFKETWHRKPNLEKINNLTNVKHKYTLEDTIKEIIASNKNS